jgi:hypothetical protein
LWFTDTPEDLSFRRLRQEGIRSQRGNAWALSQTSEPTSMVALHASGERLLLLGGRQISTRERLEVLALGSELELPSGRSLQETIASVRETGAIAVIPWGFGKWWFHRSRAVADALASSPPGGLFVGDNSSRPRGVPRSSIFELAASRGIYNLPGSDPLPLSWEIRKPGRFGCVLHEPIDLARPAESLIQALRGLRAQPPLFGRLSSIAEFTRSQMALRLRRRSPAAPAVG